MLSHQPTPVQTLLICPQFSGRMAEQHQDHAFAKRSFEARKQEAERLVSSLALDLVETERPVLREIKPATFIGGGHIERACQLIEEHHIELAVIDASLTPIQQRNLEKRLNAKVIDRTGLILEIFGARARTHEGRLQVELAALSYQRSRLIRSWTHLERQRGGFGFTGGPGERQIELDRRLIDQRIDQLNRELLKVRQTRSLHRKARTKVPYPIVALVGYTNTGKSSLFNRMTGAGILSKDMLFATLDPTMRAVTLPSKEQVMFSDTVGFVTDLPHELVDAFQATLEEVESADIIVHVRDAASVSVAEEKKDVDYVLSRLTLREDVQYIELFNKIDLLPAHEQALLKEKQLALSALTGDNIEALYQAIEQALHRNLITEQLSLPPENGAAYAFVHAHGHAVKLLEIDPDNGVQRLEVQWAAIQQARFKAKFGAYLGREAIG